MDCKKCNATMDIPPDFEPTTVCNPCAQELWHVIVSAHRKGCGAYCLDGTPCKEGAIEGDHETEGRDSAEGECPIGQWRLGTKA